jgi:hypothetical protein
MWTPTPGRIPDAELLESEREKQLIIERFFSIAESGDYIALHECLDKFSDKIPDMANVCDEDEDV